MGDNTQSEVVRLPYSFPICDILTFGGKNLFHSMQTIRSIRSLNPMTAIQNQKSQIHQLFLIVFFRETIKSPT